MGPTSESACMTMRIIKPGDEAYRQAPSDRHDRQQLTLCGASRHGSDTFATMGKEGFMSTSNLFLGVLVRAGMREDSKAIPPHPGSSLLPIFLPMGCFCKRKIQNGDDR